MHGRLVVRKVFSGWFRLGFYQTFVGGGGEVTNECCVGLNFKLMTHKVLKSYFFSDPISYLFYINEICL